MTPFPFSIKTLDVSFEQISAKEMKKYSPETENASYLDLNEDEMELLDNVRTKPFLNNTERALSLGWHRSRYSKNRKSLLKHNIVEETSFKAKLRGAPSRFLKLKGKNGYGRGKFIHAFWVEKICNYLKEQGITPQKEYRVNDKIVDIAYVKNGETVFVEVEYKSDWKSNIIRASKLCDKLVSVFVREKDIIDALAFLEEKNLVDITVTDAYYCYKVLP